MLLGWIMRELSQSSYLRICQVLRNLLRSARLAVPNNVLKIVPPIPNILLRRSNRGKNR